MKIEENSESSQKFIKNMNNKQLFNSHYNHDQFMSKKIKKSNKNDYSSILKIKLLEK